MENLVLIGGGGHCRSAIDVIEATGKYKILGIVDSESKIGTNLMGYEILGRDQDLEKIRSTCSNALVTVGQIRTPEARIRLYQTAKAAGFFLPVVVSPQAWVSPHARLGEGTVVFHGAIVNAGATVGVNGIVNSRALIEHDAVVGDHCHVSTGAILNGGAKLGEGSFLGSGAVVREQIAVGRRCVIAMAAKVYQNVADQEKFYGGST